MKALLVVLVGVAIWGFIIERQIAFIVGDVPLAGWALVRRILIMVSTSLLLVAAILFVVWWFQ